MISALAVTAALAVAEPPAESPAPTAPEAAGAPPPTPPATASPSVLIPPPAPPSASPPPPPASAPAPPPASSPRASRRIDDLNKPLMGGVPQGRYEAGVAGAFAAAENLQGPLDGAWFVSAADGRRLFRFQFDDPGYRGGRIEGAWRDLRAGPGAVEAGGFFTGVTREGSKVVIRMSSAEGEAPAVLTLEPRAGGGYGGQFAAGPQTQAVVMARP